MKDVRYLPEARIESISASNWYDEQRAGLGGEFLSALDAAQDAVVEFPESGSPGEFNTRSRTLHRFPYTLIYRVTTGGVLVVAVAHQSRRPDYWHVRINTEEE